MTNENSAETCRNPFCVLRSCRFRSDTNLEDPGSDDTPRSRYKIEGDGFGVLRVLGDIDETTDEVALELKNHSDLLKGLLVVVCSWGGQAKNVGPLRDAIAEIVATGVPVVSWIDRAFSAAFEIALASKTVFCSPEGEAGSLGVASINCFQGLLPALVVSSQTPKKNPSISRGPSSISQLTFNPKTLNKLQAGLDDDAEEILRFIAKQRSLPFLSVLEGIGDGHAAKPDELLREGLIDKICSIDEAKTELIIQVWFGEKLTEKGE